MGLRWVFSLARVAIALLLGSALTACEGSEAPPTPRHLVVVTIDTLRQDRVGAYGHDRAQTPNLDALASRGIRFDDAIAQAVITPPSHATLFTGLDPATHGLRFLYGQRLAPRHRTLAEVLRGVGFETAAFVSAVPLRHEMGLDQGFDHYDDELGGLKARSARHTNARVAAWLALPHPRRVFVWVHYFEPHHPYEPPAEVRARFAVPDEGAPAALNGNPRSGKNRSLDAASVELASRLYDAEVATVDEAVGELLAAIDGAGLLRDAIVAVVSDHGESLGEHQYYFGHWDVFDEAARVPLLLVHPDGRHAGTSVGAMVGVLDVMPTLLGWLDVVAPPGMEGIDLAPLFEGATRPAGRMQYTERGMAGQRVIRAMRDERWLLVEHANWNTVEGEATPVRLYERRTGVPASAEAAEAHARLTKALAAHARGDYETPTPVDDDVAEQLRELGYAVPEGPDS